MWFACGVIEKGITSSSLNHVMWTHWGPMWSIQWPTHYNSPRHHSWDPLSPSFNIWDYVAQFSLFTHFKTKANFYSFNSLLRVLVFVFRHSNFITIILTFPSCFISILHLESLIVLSQLHSSLCQPDFNWIER